MHKCIYCCCFSSGPVGVVSGVSCTFYTANKHEKKKSQTHVKKNKDVLFLKMDPNTQKTTSQSLLLCGNDGGLDVFLICLSVKEVVVERGFLLKSYSNRVEHGRHAVMCFLMCCQFVSFKSAEALDVMYLKRFLCVSLGMLQKVQTSKPCLSYNFNLLNNFNPHFVFFLKTKRNKQNQLF